MMAIWGALAGTALNYLSSSSSNSGDKKDSNVLRGLRFDKGKDWWKDSLSGFGILGGGDSEGSGELEDIRSEEQKRAAAALMQLAETGQFDNINLGEAYGGALGNYDTSGNDLARNQLLGLFNGQDIQGARDTFSRIAENKFDPSDPKSGYAAFSRALAKSGAEAGDVLNREAAITGNRFGTSIGGDKADLAADMNNQRGMFLADLYNQGENRALQGASGLQNVANQQAGIAQSAAQQSLIINNIKDQRARDALSEYKRQRQETLSRIDLLGTEANRNPYVGISSIPGSQSGLSSLLGSVLGGVGQQVGNSGGGWLSSLFSGGRNTGSTGSVGIGGGSGYSGSNFGGVDTSGFGSSIN